MSLIHKEPCITPEMIAAWNGNVEWTAVNNNLKYKVISGVMYVHVTMPASATSWQAVGTVPYPPEGQLLQTLDYRSGTQAMCELTTGGVVNVLNQYNGKRYTVFSYPLS